MTKAELVAVVAGEMSLTKTAAEKMVNSFLHQVSTALTTKGRVMLTGFGILEVVKRQDKKGRNPQSGEEMIIKARKAVKFKPAKALKEAINKGGHHKKKK